jgi:hypothetical protein
MAARKNNVQVLNRVSTLMNMDNVKPGLQMSDLQQLEQMMLNNGMITQTEKDPQDAFAEDLASAAKRLSVNFGDYSRGDTNDDSESSESNEYKSEYNEYKNEYLSYDDKPEQTYNNPFEAESRSDHTHGSGSSYKSNSNYVGYSTRDNITSEQQKRAHIDSIIGNTTGFSMENEKREDLKCAMLAEIDMLLQSLIDEEQDITRIPTVDINTDYSKVENTLKMLRYKSDYAQYCRFANEFILFGAMGVEELFNGERTFFGKYTPDLRQWSNTVNVKLHRMRVDTGQIVSGFMQDNRIGPITRLLLELVPSAFFHSRTRSMSRSDPMLSAEDTQKSISAINQL